MNTKISIITINYNNYNGLVETVESIEKQNYENIEYIVIDGNSTDGSADYLRSVSSSIDTLVIENDNGIYDAMNKGLKYCTGDFVIFMNSGDSLTENSSILTFVKEIQELDKVYFCRVKVISDNDSWYYPPEKFDKNNINQWLKKKLPNHQGMLFPKKFYSKTLYNIEHSISADRDYKIAAMSEYGSCFIDDTLALFNYEGVSSAQNSMKLIKKRLKDNYFISKKYYSKPRALKILFSAAFSLYTKKILYFLKVDSFINKFLSKTRK